MYGLIAFGISVTTFAAILLLSGRCGSEDKGLVVMALVNRVMDVLGESPMASSVVTSCISAMLLD
jgi:hypothetical protein